MENVSIGDMIYSETGWTKVVAKQSSGIKPVYRYITRAGSFIGTKDHRIVEDGEKVEVQYAESIDYLPVNLNIGGQIYNETAVINGLMLGDGTIRNGKPMLCVGEKDQDYFSELGSLKCQGYKYFRAIVTDLSVDVGKKTFERDFSPSDFSLYEFSFLRGLYSANGSVNISSDGSAKVVLTCTSANVATKTQDILNSLGLSPRLYKTKGVKTEWENGVYESKDRYDLVLMKNSDVLFFRDNIGFIQKYKMDKLNSVEFKETKQRKNINPIIDVEYLGDFEVFHIEVDNEPHTYWTGGLNVSNCVLSSLNLAYYDDWKHTDAVEVATVFLDCVAEEFIQRAKGIKGLEKAVRFTEKSRALGLGVCGFHTLLQKRMLPFGSFEAHMLNNEIFNTVRERAEKASRSLVVSKDTGYVKINPMDRWDPVLMSNEPEWCKGTGMCNTHLIAIAPTKSTALIMGGVSEGINPDYAMVYTQATAAGEVDRVNPQLLKIMKERGVFKKEVIDDLAINYKGSVQHVDWLSDEEKEVFKTAFEINQFDILRLAAARQKYIDQGQSLNLFFSADEDEAYISSVFKEAFLNEDIHGIYYTYSESGVQASKGECVACS